MRTRRSVIGGCAVSSPLTVAIVNNVNHVLGTGSRLVSKALNLNLTSGVLHNLEFCLFVQQVHHLSSVNLKETQVEFSASWGHLDHVITAVLSVTVNSEGLTRASLAVSEAGNNTIGEESRDEMLDLIFIQHMRVFVLSIGVVEVEVLIYDVFGDAVHLNLRLVHDDLGVRDRASINFSFRHFGREKRAFSNANANLELDGRDMVHRLGHLSFSVHNKLFKVDVADLVSRSVSIGSV